jgi:hypothetical protein
MRTPHNPSRDFDHQQFDQPSDNDQSKYGCEKYRHAFEVCISGCAQSCICLIHALLIFRLIRRFPFWSILLLSQTLQCVILSSQSIVTHGDLRNVKAVSVPRFENPRIYPDTHKSEHRQNDADLLPTIQPYPHFCAPHTRLRWNPTCFDMKNLLNLSAGREFPLYVGEPFFRCCAQYTRSSNDLVAPMAVAAISRHCAANSAPYARKSLGC